MHLVTATMQIQGEIWALLDLQSLRPSQVRFKHFTLLWLSLGFSLEPFKSTALENHPKSRSPAGCGDLHQ